MAFMKGPEKGDTDPDKKETKTLTEEDLQRNLAILEATKGRIEAFAREADILTSSIKDHERAKDTLETLKKMKSPTEMLVPIGAGLLLSAKPVTTKKVLSTIGSGISAEYSIDSALEKMGTRVEELKAKEKKVITELRKLEVSAEALTHELQAMYNEMQKGGQ